VSADAKLAVAAIKWAQAEKHKRECKRVLSDALHALEAQWLPETELDSKGRIPLIVSRLSGSDPMSGSWVSRWVYNAYAGKDLDGKQADEDPRVIAQAKAWREYREARKAAGTARGVLTRMALRAEVAK